ACGVDGHDRPHVCRTRATPTVAGPRRARGIGVARWNRVPTPAERAASRVVRADHAALQLDAAIVADRGADDDEPAHDGGRRSDLIAAAVVADADALAEIDLSVTSEAWAGCPGRGVERDEPRVDGCDEDAPTTGATRTRVGIEPR